MGLVKFILAKYTRILDVALARQWLAYINGEFSARATFVFIEISELSTTCLYERDGQRVGVAIIYKYAAVKNFGVRF